MGRLTTTWAWGMAVAAAGCTASGETPPEATDVGLTDEAASTDLPPPADPSDLTGLTHQFSFVIIADPHVTREGPNAERLADVMAWIDAEHEALDLAFGVFVGDIAWGNGHPVVADLIADSPIPLVPILGDNPIQSGGEAAAGEAFETWTAGLSEALDGWRRMPTPVEGSDGLTWYQATAWDHGGVHFVGCDWNARVRDPFLGEFADLHDVDDGPFPWFADDLEAHRQGPDAGIVMFSHHPMLALPGGFDASEVSRLAEVTLPMARRLYANFGGHLHLDSAWDAEVGGAGFEIQLTDATFDDDNRVRVVEAWSDAEQTRFGWQHDVAEVPARAVETDAAE